MHYNPDSLESQAMLSSSLLALMHESGFAEEYPERTKERVFSREVTPEIRIAVYTSIDPRRGIVRDCGKDAIRVCLIRRCNNGTHRGLGRQTRINRVGKIADIVGRVQERMRASWRNVGTLNHCSACGAPTFVSKRKNDVCSELCWRN